MSVCAAKPQGGAPSDCTRRIGLLRPCVCIANTALQATHEAGAVDHMSSCSAADSAPSRSRSARLKALLRKSLPASVSSTTCAGEPHSDHLTATPGLQLGVQGTIASAPHLGCPAAMLAKAFPSHHERGAAAPKLHLVGRVLEADGVQELIADAQLVVVAELAQHRPCRLQPPALDEQRVQEQEAAQRQALGVDALQGTRKLVHVVSM